jgi:hypothetical protein
MRGLDHARELDQDPVTCRFDDSAAMLGDFGGDQVPAQRLERNLSVRRFPDILLPVP